MILKCPYVSVCDCVALSQTDDLSDEYPNFTQQQLWPQKGFSKLRKWMDAWVARRVNVLKNLQVQWGEYQ